MILLLLTIFSTYGQSTCVEKVHDFWCATEGCSASVSFESLHLCAEEFKIQVGGTSATFYDNGIERYNWTDGRGLPWLLSVTHYVTDLNKPYRHSSSITSAVGATSLLDYDGVRYLVYGRITYWSWLTQSPSESPTNTRTSYPTSPPSKLPSNSPTNNPTTSTPTRLPSYQPTNVPSDILTVPTNSPTSLPSEYPSRLPSNMSTESPTVTPSNIPTVEPTYSSESPSNLPTAFPTVSPTRNPTVKPIYAPSSSPTNSPTNYPTSSPTDLPSKSPTNSPTFNPTEVPTFRPSPRPTTIPTPPGIGGTNDENYCRPKRKCNLGQGDCDTNNDCALGLTCGSKNCRQFHPNAASNMDCCYVKPGIGGPGDGGYCNSRKCQEGQGDCDRDSQCAGALVCGRGNCQIFHPNAHPHSNCCTLRITSLPLRKKSDWKNEFDGVLDWSVGKDGMIIGMHSQHSNSKEDRVYGFHYATHPRVTCEPQAWSAERNTWNAVMSYTCHKNQALNGVKSYHSDHHEDRIWRFRCCDLSSNNYLEHEEFTYYVNKYDKSFDFRCKEGRVMVGLYSQHSDHNEDRKWRVKCAKLFWKPKK